MLLNLHKVKDDLIVIQSEGYQFEVIFALQKALATVDIRTIIVSQDIHDAKI